jgi:hypothetical protein
MFFRMKRYALVCLASLLVTGTSWAANPIVDPATGKLTGATEVQIFIAVDDDVPDDGAIQCFNVEFTDSRCHDAIPGCSNGNAFVIPNSPSARNAVQALLDQVLQDGPSAGPEDDFDSDPTLTRGCEDSPDSCDLYVPYRYDAVDDMLNQVAVNDAAPSPDSTVFTRGELTSNPTGDVADINWTSTYLPTTRGTDNATWAVFSPCPNQPVPEPSSVIYLLYGLAGLVAVSVVRARSKHRG